MRRLKVRDAIMSYVLLKKIADDGVDIQGIAFRIAQIMVVIGWFLGILWFFMSLTNSRIEFFDADGIGLSLMLIFAGYFFAFIWYLAIRILSWIITGR